MNYKDELHLQHFGVPGMKWGKRKGYTELSPRQQKRISSKYKKLAVKTATKMAYKDQEFQFKAYNKMADRMNGGLIKKFNDTHNPKSKNYEKNYEKLAEKIFTEEYMNLKVSSLINDRTYKKSKKLVDKYELTKYDTLAKDNEQEITRIKKEMEKK